MALKSKPTKEVREIPAATMANVGEQVRVNILVPKSLRSQWKQAALNRDITVTELIMQAMSKYLHE